MNSKVDAASGAALLLGSRGRGYDGFFIISIAGPLPICTIIVDAEPELIDSVIPAEEPESSMNKRIFITGFPVVAGNEVGYC